MTAHIDFSFEFQPTVGNVSRKRIERLGNLQLRILRVLWEMQRGSVAEVHQALAPQADLAYTTIATMLRKMEARGLVDHEEQGRRFIYRPLVSEDEVSRGMTDDLVERLFSGNLPELVSQLLDSREVSADELDQLEELIAAKRRKP